MLRRVSTTHVLMRRGAHDAQLLSIKDEAGFKSAREPRDGSTRK